MRLDSLEFNVPRTIRRCGWKQLARPPRTCVVSAKDAVVAWDGGLAPLTYDDTRVAVTIVCLSIHDWR